MSSDDAKSPAPELDLEQRIKDIVKQEDGQLWTHVVRSRVKGKIAVAISEFLTVAKRIEGRPPIVIGNASGDVRSGCVKVELKVDPEWFCRQTPEMQSALMTAAQFMDET